MQARAFLIKAAWNDDITHVPCGVVIQSEPHPVGTFVFQRDLWDWCRIEREEQIIPGQVSNASASITATFLWELNLVWTWFYLRQPGTSCIQNISPLNQLYLLINWIVCHSRMCLVSIAPHFLLAPVCELSGEMTLNEPLTAADHDRWWKEELRRLAETPEEKNLTFDLRQRCIC